MDRTLEKSFYEQGVHARSLHLYVKRVGSAIRALIRKLYIDGTQNTVTYYNGGFVYKYDNKSRIMLLMQKTN
jgi:hypothetical protein